MRLTRHKYRCGQCRRHYDLPGADLSFFYGWFLGISRNLETVAFEAVSYPGIDEINEILDIVSGELADSYPDNRMTAALSRVCDPDSHGDRYIFSGTPGCPTCKSTRVRNLIDTGEWWPQPAGTPTHQIWESLDRQAKILQVRDALGLGKPIG